MGIGTPFVHQLVICLTFCALAIPAKAQERQPASQDQTVADYFRTAGTHRGARSR